MQRGTASLTSPSDPTADLPLSAWISTDDWRQPCFVVDLSVDGARVHCAKPLLTGTWVELCLPDQSRLPAEVAWQAGNRMGLKFAGETPPLLV